MAKHLVIVNRPGRDFRFSSVAIDLTSLSEFLFDIKECDFIRLYVSSFRFSLIRFNHHMKNKQGGEFSGRLAYAIGLLYNCTVQKRKGNLGEGDPKGINVNDL